MGNWETLMWFYEEMLIMDEHGCSFMEKFISEIVS